MIYRIISMFPAVVMLMITSVAAQEDQEVFEGPTVSVISSTETFGEELSMEDPTSSSVSRVMNDTTMHNTTVKVNGTILDVCQKKGCWMVVSDGESQMRITFKDYGFFVPIDCSGKDATIEGIVTVEEISEDLAKHYAEESVSEDPETITGPQQVVTMVATGVRIYETE